MRVNVSPHFKRAYRRLPTDIQKDFDRKITWFLSNPYDTRLGTHKLHGRLHHCLAFCLRDGYRVLFELATSDAANLLDAGPHDNYSRW